MSEHLHGTSGGVGGAVAAATLAAAGAAAAAGVVAVERAAHQRRQLSGLDRQEGFEQSGFEQTPDEVYSVVATDGIRLHVEVDHPRGGGVRMPLGSVPVAGAASAVGAATGTGAGAVGRSASTNGAATGTGAGAVGGAAPAAPTANGDGAGSAGGAAYGIGMGAPNGPLPTVVFSHGFTLSRKSWVFERRALAQAGYRVVVWDQRGHGKSDPSDDAHATIEQLGHDLNSVIAAVAPQGDLVLVGHSMGGMTIMSLAHHHPEVVRERAVAVGFVATSPGGKGLTDLDFGPLVGQILGRVGPKLLHRLGRYNVSLLRLRRFGRNVEDVLVQHYSYDSPVSQELVRFTGDMIFETTFTTMSQFLTAIEALNEAAALEVFRGIETLVINGRGDLLTPPPHSEEILRRIPGAEHVLVEEAGHLIMLEHPELVSQQLLMLIERALRARTDRVAVDRKPRVRRVVTDLAKRRRIARVRNRSARRPQRSSA